MPASDKSRTPGVASVGDAVVELTTMPRTVGAGAPASVMLPDKVAVVWVIAVAGEVVTTIGGSTTEAAAANASTSPNPTWLGPPAIGTAVEVSASLICCGVSEGFRLLSNAATAAACGLDAEVPQKLYVGPVPPKKNVVNVQSLATRSGLVGYLRRTQRRRGSGGGGWAESRRCRAPRRSRSPASCGQGSQALLRGPARLVSRSGPSSCCQLCLPAKAW